MDDKIIKCESRPATEEEIFYSDLGKDLIKGSAAAAQDGCRQLVTLNALLLGGGVIFLQAAEVLLAARAVAFACFLLSLSASIAGSIPSATKIDWTQAAKVREFYDRIVKWRLLSLKAAVFLLALGLLSAVLGVFFK